VACRTLTVALLAGLLACRPNEPAAPSGATSNVLLIVIDTLRADMLSCYGGPVATPNIDALASSGVLFRRAYAHAPMTMPSHSSMFTSLLPSEHGARLNAEVLPGDNTTLAEVLHDAHRHTAAFVSLGVLTADYGTAQGFDEFYDFFETNWWKDANEMNRQILPWLEGGPTEPFFLWTHYSDPHEPYSPPGTEYGRMKAVLDGKDASEIVLDGTVQDLPLELDAGEHEIVFEPAGGKGHPLSLWQVLVADVDLSCGQRCTEKPGVATWSSFSLSLPGSLILRNSTQATVATELSLRAMKPEPGEVFRQRYQGEVAYVDQEVGRLLDLLHRSGLDERTLVVLTADHGEGLGDHGLGGHAEQLYDTLLRVPLIVSFPGRVPAGRAIEQPVAHVDLLPTVLDLLGIPDGAKRDGRSLVPLIDSKEMPSVPIFAETFRPQAPKNLQAVVVDGYKMIRTLGEKRVELYDLAADPGELDDLADEQPEIARRLLRMTRARIREHSRRSPARTLSPEEQKKLRALGYLQ